MDDGAGSASDSVERMLILAARRQALDAEIVALVGEVERSGEFRDDGHTSVLGWLRAITRCSTDEAVGWRQVARMAHACPELADELASGPLGVAQARVLGRVFANTRARDHFPASVELFLEQASTLSFREFSSAAHYWEQLADADGAFREATRIHDDRKASIREADGEWTFQGSCGGLQGATLKDVWDRFTEAEAFADWDQARTEHGDAATPEHLPRTEPQRRLDALIEALTVAASTPLDAQRPEPLVNLIGDVSVLNDFLRPDDDTHGRPTPRPGTRPSETIDGHPVPLDDIVRAAIHGQVRRVIAGPSGVILEFGRRRRLFTGAARDAVLLTARSCCWAGCGRPASTCQADHSLEWQHGGTTDVANAGPLCRWHNLFKTRHRYRSWRDPATGTWHTYRPDGSEITQPHAA